MGLTLAPRGRDAFGRHGACVGCNIASKQDHAAAAIATAGTSMEAYRVQVPVTSLLKEFEAELEVAFREDALCAAHASYSSRYCKARENFNMNSEFRLNSY